MHKYELTEQAEADIISIWRYTAKNWGKTQADNYFKKIENCFDKIANDKIVGKTPLAAYKKLKSVKCENHYIFFLKENKTIIIAILHEKMDFINRLEKRLTIV